MGNRKLHRMHTYATGSFRVFRPTPIRANSHPVMNKEVSCRVESREGVEEFPAHS